MTVKAPIGFVFEERCRTVTLEAYGEAKPYPEEVTRFPATTLVEACAGDRQTAHVPGDLREMSRLNID